MLTGTLITAAGFLPIATAPSGTGEYTRSIFQVVTIALLLCWIAAVVFIPYLGDRLLPDARQIAAARKADRPSLLRERIASVLPAWLATCVAPAPTAQAGHERSVRHAVLPALPRLDRLVRRAPQAR